MRGLTPDDPVIASQPREAPGGWPTPFHATGSTQSDGLRWATTGKSARPVDVGPDLSFIPHHVLIKTSIDVAAMANVSALG